MKVRIGKMLYDSDVEPIVLILDNEEKSVISSSKGSVFYSFPEQFDIDTVNKFYKDSLEVI